MDGWYLWLLYLVSLSQADSCRCGRWCSVRCSTMVEANASGRAPAHAVAAGAPRKQPHDSETSDDSAGRLQQPLESTEETSEYVDINSDGSRAPTLMVLSVTGAAKAIQPDDDSD